MLYILMIIYYCYVIIGTTLFDDIYILYVLMYQFYLESE